MEEESVLGKVVTRPPDCHVVQRILKVAVLEMSILNDVFETVQTVVVRVEDVLGCFCDMFEQRIDEVEVQRIVSDEVPYCAADDRKQCLGRRFLIHRASCHLRPKIKVVDIHGYPAIPCRDKLGCLVVGHL